MQKEEEKKEEIKNDLNHLSANEWINQTQSVWITHYPLDVTWEARKTHPATKPPQVMRDIISFFTQRDDRVLDVYAGVGSALIGASMCGRNAVGIEVNRHYVDTFDRIKTLFSCDDGAVIPRDEKTKKNDTWEAMRMIHGNAVNRTKALRPESIDFVICDLPDTIGESKDPNDMTSVKSYDEYLVKIKELGEQVHRILKDKKYWVILSHDQYRDGAYFPFSYHVALAMKEKGFQWKGLTHWTNDARRNLKGYSLGKAFVPNFVHTNLIVLRKP